MPKTRKQQVAWHFSAIAEQRMQWFRRNWSYHEQIYETCRLYLNPDARVLELGCGAGQLIGALKPQYALGIDIAENMIAQASRHYPQYDWLCADVESLPDHEALKTPFDLIIIEDLLGYLDDIQQFLSDIRPLMHPNTRLVISTWNWLWEPILLAGETLRLKSPDIDFRQNWISASALDHFLKLTSYETLKIEPGLLLPYHLPGISPLVNSLSHAPLMQRLTLLSMLVARPIEQPAEQHTSVSVIIPTRNERDNIARIVESVPQMGTHTELLFVDGSSTDGTVEAIHEQIALNPGRDIKFMPQVPPHDPDSDTPPNLMLKLGKGDAVRKGFAAASGEILMIYDSDVSVAPEDLLKFYHVLATGQADFANGTRFVYKQESGAMRGLNRLGNITFSYMFSWLLGQHVTDTLCGTKVLFKKDYKAIAANRSYFGDFDPFGDFDLLFGAAWLGHRILDVPVHYLARTYGESKVRVGKHGILLLRMSWIAFWQFKVRPLLGQQRPQKRPLSAQQPEMEYRSTRRPILSALIILFTLLILVLFRRKR